MYSPKYVDYLDEKCIESAFYNPKSKPKIEVGINSENAGNPHKLYVFACSRRFFYRLC